MFNPSNKWTSNGKAWVKILAPCSIDNTFFDKGKSYLLDASTAISFITQGKACYDPCMNNESKFYNKMVKIKYED
jgi:hypothetical protein